MHISILEFQLHKVTKCVRKIIKGRKKFAKPFQIAPNGDRNLLLPVDVPVPDVIVSDESKGASEVNRQAGSRTKKENKASRDLRKHSEKQMRPTGKRHPQGKEEEKGLREQCKNQRDWIRISEYH